MEINRALKVMEMNTMPISVIDVNVVKRQYKKMALKLHPDKNGNTPESNEKFQELSESYTCLLTMVSENTYPDEECKNDEDEVFHLHLEDILIFFDNLLKAVLIIFIVKVLWTRLNIL